MKKDITIKIADNLTPQQEVVAIAKQLAKKQLSGGGQNKDIKRIGDELNIQHLKTTITIDRVSTEKPIIMLTCNVCGCDYQSDMTKHYFHNYGGKNTKRSVCSDGCQQFMIEYFGVRVAKSASKLKPIFGSIGREVGL